MLRAVWRHAYGPAMGEAAILTGDVGGTNVRFALAHVKDGAIGLSDVWKRPGADFRTFDAAIDAYLSGVKAKVAGASFGLAGAVANGRVEVLHRGWTVDVAKLKAKLGYERVVVVNDFFAMARSAPELRGPGPARDFCGQGRSGWIAGGWRAGYGVRRRHFTALFGREGKRLGRRWRRGRASGIWAANEDRMGAGRGAAQEARLCVERDRGFGLGVRGDA